MEYRVTIHIFFLFLKTTLPFPACMEVPSLSTLLETGCVVFSLTYQAYWPVSFLGFSLLISRQQLIPCLAGVVAGTSS